MKPFELHGNLSRRDFLKLTSLTPFLVALQPLRNVLENVQTDHKNILMIVFDAWSAHNVQLYGYPRRTMPNLEQLTENAVVYHNHYSPATFTVPGTASLLTGLYPWSHRALQLGSGIMQSQVKAEIFSLLQSTHFTFGYTQNTLADVIMGQVEPYLDKHLKAGSFGLVDRLLYDLPVFKNDSLIAYTALENNLFQINGLGTDSSLFIAPLIDYWTSLGKTRLNAEFAHEYPKGLPVSSSAGLYTLESVVDGVIDSLGTIKEPVFAYIHFYPPHEPYSPTAKFSRSFNDGWEPPVKPSHALAKGKNAVHLNNQRKLYDQYLASWDNAVSKLFNFFNTSGLRDHSYIFITSDHGEMFERGELGHFTPLMFDPVMHIPLIVLSPGQNGRKDIYAPTSNVDLLPTVMRLANLSIPAWVEGEVLPWLGGNEDTSRSLFTIDAKENSSFLPLTKFSVSITKNGFRLTHYKYPDTYEGFELYNLLDDREEMRDLYSANPSELRALRDELVQKVTDVNRPYERQ